MTDSTASSSASTAASSASSNSSTTSNPSHPFYTLPHELILDILDLLAPESFINFAFANYPLLQTHGLAPALSQRQISYITTQTSISANFPLLRVPAETMLQIMRELDPIDLMRFCLANYQVLAGQGIAPELTREDVGRLRQAVRGGLGEG